MRRIADDYGRSAALCHAQRERLAGVLDISARTLPRRPQSHIRLLPGRVRQRDRQAHPLLLPQHHVRDHTELVLQAHAGLAAPLLVVGARRAGHFVQHALTRGARPLPHARREDVHHILHEVRVPLRHTRHHIQVPQRDDRGAQLASRPSARHHLVHVQVAELLRGVHGHHEHLLAHRHERRQARVRAAAARGRPAAHAASRQVHVRAHLRRLCDRLRLQLVRQASLQVRVVRDRHHFASATAAAAARAAERRINVHCGHVRAVNKWHQLRRSAIAPTTTGAAGDLSVVNKQLSRRIPSGLRLRLQLARACQRLDTVQQYCARLPANRAPVSLQLGHRDQSVPRDQALQYALLQGGQAIRASGGRAATRSRRWRWRRRLYHAAGPGGEGVESNEPPSVASVNIDRHHSAKRQRANHTLSAPADSCQHRRLQGDEQEEQNSANQHTRSQRLAANLHLGHALRRLVRLRRAQSALRHPHSLSSPIQGELQAARLSVITIINLYSIFIHL